jgi:tRNA U38,U39,U40 pseudouridine synthase TruA
MALLLQKNATARLPSVQETIEVRVSANPKPVKVEVLRHFHHLQELEGLSILMQAHVVVVLLPQKAVVGLVGEGNHGVCQVSSRTDAGVHALANVRTPFPPTPPSHVEA